MNGAWNIVMCDRDRGKSLLGTGGAWFNLVDGKKTGRYC